jgi:glycosyltransferase involved in cell wall biosynthesis
VSSAFGLGKDDDSMRPRATTQPQVSIGLPVRNGARFLAETLDSLLSQTLEDFELIISDNASEDGTWEICQAYAHRDRRIRLLRNQRNLGAAANYNTVFLHARGRYFKWAAHDDVCAPPFLERCVEALESRPEIVLAYTRTALVDGEGRPLPTGEARARVDDPDPRVRFRDCLSPMKLWQNPIFGVIRRECLARTPLIGAFLASDRCLVAELSLMGPFHEVPEVLFYRRKHAGNIGSRPSHLGFYDPRLEGRIVIPELRVFREHLRTLSRAPIPAGLRWRLRLEVLAWAWRRRRIFRKQVVQAARAWVRQRARGEPALDEPYAGLEESFAEGTRMPMGGRRIS